jgi:hypothetical protein
MRDTAYNRVSNAFRSEEDSQILGKVGALLIGVEVGLLIAPARGETREPTSPRRFREFSYKVRSALEKKPQNATGTRGD